MFSFLFNKSHIVLILNNTIIFNGSRFKVGLIYLKIYRYPVNKNQENAKANKIVFRTWQRYFFRAIVLLFLGNMITRENVNI